MGLPILITVARRMLHLREQEQAAAKKKKSPASQRPASKRAKR